MVYEYSWTVFVYTWNYLCDISGRMLFFPEKWQFKNGELSDLGRLWQQVGGGIIAAMGIFIMSGMAMLLAK